MLQLFFLQCHMIKRNKLYKSTLMENHEVFKNPMTQTNNNSTMFHVHN